MYVRMCKNAYVNVTFTCLCHKYVVGIFFDGTFISNISLYFSNFQLLDLSVCQQEAGNKIGQKRCKDEKELFQMGYLHC